MQKQQPEKAKPPKAATNGGFKVKPNSHRTDICMKTNTQQAARQGAPNFGQMVALAMEKAEHDLKGLLEARAQDDRWSDDDVSVDLSIELAFDHLKQMKNAEFKSKDDFCWEWYKVGAAVKQSCKLFTRKDCFYYRSLERTSSMFENVADLVQFVGA